MAPRTEISSSVGAVPAASASGNFTERGTATLLAAHDPASDDAEAVAGRLPRETVFVTQIGSCASLSREQGLLLGLDRIHPATGSTSEVCSRPRSFPRQRPATPRAGTGGQFVQHSGDSGTESCGHALAFAGRQDRPRAAGHFATEGQVQTGGILAFVPAHVGDRRLCHRGRGRLRTPPAWPDGGGRAGSAHADRKHERVAAE